MNQYGAPRQNVPQLRTVLATKQDRRLSGVFLHLRFVFCEPGVVRSEINRSIEGPVLRLSAAMRLRDNYHP